MAARSASPAMVCRNARTSPGSAFQSIYSGGSKAGNRCMGIKVTVLWAGGGGLPARQKSTVASGDLHHRSEEHTSELQSRLHLVCRLLLEKKKKKETNEKKMETY